MRAAQAAKAHAGNAILEREDGLIQPVPMATYFDPWFDYLFVSKREMRELLKGSGWRIRRLLGPARPHYAAIIERERAP